MQIWAISDLHLSFGIANKKMDLFGQNWLNHAEKMASTWDAIVSPNDLVLIAGDISWALRLNEALPDLQWIEARPGKKIIIRGNHDFWWESISKVRNNLPSSIIALQNDTFITPQVSIAGARLWESPEYSFEAILDYKPNTQCNKKDLLKDSEIFTRELMRLEMSLQQLPENAPLKIAMTHYPPIGLDLQETSASRLFRKYGVHIVIFGHLHSFKNNLPLLFGTVEGTTFYLTSSDYLDFRPLKIAHICAKTS